MDGQEQRRLTDSTDDSQITDDSLEEPGKVDGHLISALCYTVYHWIGLTTTVCKSIYCGLDMTELKL